MQRIVDYLRNYVANQEMLCYPSLRVAEKSAVILLYIGVCFTYTPVGHFCALTSAPCSRPCPAEERAGRKRSSRLLPVDPSFPEEIPLLICRCAGRKGGWHGCQS